LEWVESNSLAEANPTLPLPLQGGGMGDIPSALFDCVADNLIDNACNKRLREPGIRITVTLSSAPFSLSVNDTGRTILPSVARQLLTTIMPSEDGLGVGLYQAARWASQMGFRIALAENKPNHVRFELREASPQ
jgi:sensor histidine kinase regulating citrate/malate metabolism